MLVMQRSTCKNTWEEIRFISSGSSDYFVVVVFKLNIYEIFAKQLRTLKLTTIKISKLLTLSWLYAVAQADAENGQATDGEGRRTGKAEDSRQADIWVCVFGK